MSTPDPATLTDLVAISAAVAATRSRKAKVELLAQTLAGLEDDDADIGVAWLTGELRQGKIGIGAAALRGLDAPPAATATLTLADVDAIFARIAACRGAGSQGERRALLEGLMRQATAEEQRFVQRLVVGELRQGALADSLTDALARATDRPLPAVRRAAMLSGDLRAVARAARSGSDLNEFRIEVGRPIQPMLAQSAASPTEAIGDNTELAFETKLDGARIQVHRDGSDVAIFTRNLNDVTASLPEVVDTVLQLPARSLVLDGEALALDPAGRPLPFQTTMRRFGRRSDVAALRAELPLRTFCFDVLYHDGEECIDAPYRERAERLASIVAPELRAARTVTPDAATAERFLREVLAAGHEGVVAKALDAPYEAGRRGAAWLKIKPAHTLDLVVLAAEWGSGRRTGKLSNLHLGARDPETGTFVMVGKTFKGLTDVLLAWQTERLLELATERDGHVVHVRPELVVEIAIDGVQRSPHYPGGAALRFARVRGYRADRSPTDADTIDTVRAIGGLDAR